MVNFVAKLIGMKKIVFLCVVAIGLGSCGDKSTTNEAKSTYDVNKELYERALKLDDMGTAVVALNYMLIEDSTNMEYTDSLARHYITNGNFDSGIELGKVVMEEDPTNYKLLELIATAQEYKGDVSSLTKSYKNFRKLYKEVGDIRYMMKMAQIGMVQQKYPSALARLDTIIADPNTTMMESPLSQGGSQMIDIKSGAYFMKAQYEFSLNNMLQGSQYLKMALNVTPKYEAALILTQRLNEFNQQQVQRPTARSGASSSKKAKELQEDKKYQDWKNRNSGK